MATDAQERIDGDRLELTDEGSEMLERMWPVYARGIAEDFLPAFGTNSDEIRRALETIGESCDAQRTEAGEPAAAQSRG